MKQSLPIDPLISEIRGKLLEAPALILRASPGSGKTTRVPPALLEEAWTAGKEIWVLVPRRLAAKMAAFRIAEERGEAVGGTIGYQFRFEKVVGPKTRLKLLTEGMLLRLLRSDPILSKVAAVVLDEFHERHLHTDVALGLLKRLQGTCRPDLKLLIMSATLETGPLSRYLGGVPVISLETPRHPVELQYLPHPSKRRLEDEILDAVREQLRKSQTREGDCLVFLPGMAEIRRSESRLLESLRDQVVIIPLHGDLSKEEQARAFQRFPKPKVILATNIAETSITFEGVTTVVDSGLHRQASFSWWSGIPRLTTKNVSRASAIQRAGRAGRTGPGRCLRLYTKSDFEGRPEFDLPEIRRSDLAQVLLEIKGLGASLRDFPWFEPPPPAATEAGGHLLHTLGATVSSDLDAPLTDLGRRMAEFPLHPRLARVLLEAEKRQVTEPAAAVVVNLSEGESASGGEAARRLRSQILASVPASSKGSEEDLAFSFLTGFPDRVAQKRKGTKGREVDLVLATGGSVTAENTGEVAAHDYFVVLDAQERKRQGSGSSAVQVNAFRPIREDWLLGVEASLLKERDEAVWEPSLRKAQQVSRLLYGDLILSETRGPVRDPRKAADLLLREGLGLKPSDDLSVADFLKAVEHAMDPEPVEAALTRLKLIQAIPAAIGGKALGGLIERALEGLNGLSDLSPEDLARRLLETQPHDVQKKIEAQLPTHVLFKGRRVRVHYRWDQKPWIESRLQDFFGMTKGPAILGGSIPLTLHLLAPNRRPVQVTQDLASFWKNAYPQIRKELMRKYPKHKWPEEPIKAH